MRNRPVLILALTVVGCGGGNSKQDALREAANQSTPEAARVLNGAADNGMNAQVALNEAAEAQERNTTGDGRAGNSG